MNLGCGFCLSQDFLALAQGKRLGFENALHIETGVVYLETTYHNLHIYK